MVTNLTRVLTDWWAQQRTTLPDGMSIRALAGGAVRIEGADGAVVLEKDHQVILRLILDAGTSNRSERDG